MNDIIMAGGNLDDIMGRLNACAAVFRIIHAGISEAGDLTDALYGAIDLLDKIIRDLQADIESAEEISPDDTEQEMKL